jgi:hypothetical protein
MNGFLDIASELVRCQYLYFIKWKDELSQNWELKLNFLLSLIVINNLTSMKDNVI